MKLLISAYACAPNHGSEHAIGWNWVTEAHRLGHEVWAVVSPAHRQKIETVCGEASDLNGIHWVFPEIAAWQLRPSIEPKWERTYNLFWQRAALRRAKELHRKVEFDAVHHLTWGGIRAPTFLGSLGAPLIVGPLGGGETSPSSLRDGFHIRAKVTERIRDLSNATITINPLVRGGLSRAAIIFVKTPDTARLLTRTMREKAVAFIELGLPAAQIGQPRTAWGTPPRFLYAGRLLYWKGVHIAIRALAEIVRRKPGARLTIVGKGPERDRLMADARALGIGESVDFVSWLPQQQLFELFASHDLFIFPSLHDSSGGVVMEALSSGLPVVCLDIGGPKYIVTSNSGVIVSTRNLDTAAVARAMADEVFNLLASPKRLSSLSAGAIERANQFILSKRVAEFYDCVAEIIGMPRAGASAAPPRLAATWFSGVRTSKT